MQLPINICPPSTGSGLSLSALYLNSFLWLSIFIYNLSYIPINTTLPKYIPNLFLIPNTNTSFTTKTFQTPSNSPNVSLSQSSFSFPQSSKMFTYCQSLQVRLSPLIFSPFLSACCLDFSLDILSLFIGHSIIHFCLTFLRGSLLRRDVTMTGDRDEPSPAPTASTRPTALPFSALRNSCKGGMILKGTRKMCTANKIE